MKELDGQDIIENMHEYPQRNIANDRSFDDNEANVADQCKNIMETTHEIALVHDTTHVGPQVLKVGCH